MLNGQIKHSYLGNTCSVVLPHAHVSGDPSPSTVTQADAAAASGAEGTSALHVDVDRLRNCDIFIGDNDLYFYADVKLYKFHSRRPFELKELKTLSIYYDTIENCYQFCLPCLPAAVSASSGGASGLGVNNSGGSLVIGSGNGMTTKPKTIRKEYISNYLRMEETLPDNEPLVQEWKLKRITEQCQLQLNNQEPIYKLTNNFYYGYASKYSGELQTHELDRVTCRVSEPQFRSPMQRRIDRIVDEMKQFSREQYKLNFVELQVPPGHHHPMRYKPKIYVTSMTQEQAHLLHNLSCHGIEEVSLMRHVQNEIDCGLISIVLAICYDVRTTANESTCESGWTRSMLCPLFCYFEQFDNYKDVLVAFLRRVITYPLYRNFELGRLCVKDAIEVLKGGRNWLINQLLLTHQQFSKSEPSREVNNIYYLEDYIRYVTNATICSDEYLRLLARNVKNVLMDVNKRHLDLSVAEIETELIRELMQEMRINRGGESPLDVEYDTSDETTTDDDSDSILENEDEDEEEDDDDNDSKSSTSDDEGNSVIEQCSNSNSNSEAAASANTK